MMPDHKSLYTYVHSGDLDDELDERIDAALSMLQLLLVRQKMLKAGEYSESEQTIATTQLRLITMIKGLRNGWKDL